MTFNYILQDIDSLRTLTYCITCIDEGSKLLGTFAYDEALYLQGYGMWAISPVFADVEDFYLWAKRKGFIYHDRVNFLTMSKSFS